MFFYSFICYTFIMICLWWSRLFYVPQRLIDELRFTYNYFIKLSYYVYKIVLQIIFYLWLMVKIFKREWEYLFLNFCLNKKNIIWNVLISLKFFLSFLSLVSSLLAKICIACNRNFICIFICNDQSCFTLIKIF